MKRARRIPKDFEKSCSGKINFIIGVVLMAAAASVVVVVVMVVVVVVMVVAVTGGGWGVEDEGGSYNLHIKQQHCTHIFSLRTTSYFT